MKKVALLILILGVLGGGVMGYRWLQTPTTSTTIEQPTQTNNKVLGDKITLTPWQTAYFSTLIPNTLRVRTTTENNLQAKIGSYFLSNVSAQAAAQVGVTVAALGNNSLGEIPGVKLRLNSPSQYMRGSRSYAPAGAYVFSTTTDDETSIFWEHDGSYAAVVVSGSAAQSGYLEQTVSSIISNWQWR